MEVRGPSELAASSAGTADRDRHQLDGGRNSRMQQATRPRREPGPWQPMPVSSLQGSLQAHAPFCKHRDRPVSQKNSLQVNSCVQKRAPVAGVLRAGRAALPLWQQPVEGAIKQPTRRHHAAVRLRQRERRQGPSRRVQALPPPARQLGGLGATLCAPPDSANRQQRAGLTPRRRSPPPRLAFAHPPQPLARRCAARRLHGLLGAGQARADGRVPEGRRLPLCAAGGAVEAAKDCGNQGVDLPCRRAMASGAC